MSGIVQPALKRFKTEYLGRYAAPMAACEAALRRISGLNGGTLGEACGLTLDAGGKRMRPLLVFLSARGGNAHPGLEESAVAIELVHMATLVHDDILDGADLRRGKPTLSYKYGAATGTAAGDYLFAAAFEVMAAAGLPRAVNILAAASLGLSMGELMQRRQTRDFGLRVIEYEERCRLKTAGLFSASCRLGALFSGCSEETIAALDEYGRYLGLAFQIADDVLDFTGESQEIGKRAGADLRDGTVTLPLILALDRDPSLAELLAASPGEDEFAAVCRQVKSTGALDEAAELARDYVDRAARVLAPASAELDTEPLRLVAEMAADRRV